MVSLQLSSNATSLHSDGTSRCGSFKIILTEWFLHTLMVNKICQNYGRPLVDLFATSRNRKLLMYVSPVPDAMVWKDDSFQHPWDHLYALCFFPLHVSLLGFSRITASTNLMILVTSHLGHSGSGSQICCPC